MIRLRAAILPVGIVRALDDDDRGRDPAGIVDRDIALGIDRIERVVAGLERGRQLHLAERIEDADLLPKPCAYSEPSPRRRAVTVAFSPFGSTTMQEPGQRHRFGTMTPTPLPPREPLTRQT